MTITLAELLISTTLFELTEWQLQWYSDKNNKISHEMCLIWSRWESNEIIIRSYSYFNQLDGLSKGAIFAGQYSNIFIDIFHHTIGRVLNIIFIKDKKIKP